jgi:N-sulfoglucosamine sulfohydrolase
MMKPDLVRPNILFAFGDDWGRYASAYRAYQGADSLSGLIRTSNFDRVAGEGVLFSNAYVPAPSCTPCRSSILAGQYFWQTGLGAILQGARWDESIPTYPLELEKAGYHIGYTYKVWSPGLAQNAPYGGERSRYEAAGTRFRNFSIEASQPAAETGIDAAKRALYDETRSNFDSFLAARPADAPFCYWWGPTNTHRGWEKGSGKALWGIDPDSLAGRLPAFLPDAHDIREDVADYLGECMALDAGLGVLLDRLAKIGELDNTLIVVSGDHGIPGFPRAKCNLYDIGCEVALAARWPGRIPHGRVVDDFINLMDLGPTFLDAAGVAVPSTMTARSLLPILESVESGQIEADRTFVVTGRERHVADARDGYLPYPQRAIRTSDYLYVHNFAPDRWPIGTPNGLDDPDAAPPPFEVLETDTFVAYPDMDASPTKAWMIHHRADADVRRAFDLGFGKRPQEELYDLRVDPHYLNNVAGAAEYAADRDRLQQRLMRVLREEKDPRVVEDPPRFEQPPYAGPVSE